MAALLLSTGFAEAVAQSPVSAYDPLTEGVVSGYLCIDRETNYLSGVVPGTSLEELNRLTLPGDLTTASEVLTTGTVLTSAAADRQLTLILTGDLNGDGDVTISDMLMVKAHLLGEELTALAAAAADVNYDGDISISDFLNIKANLLGLSQISFRDSADREPMILLAPGETQLWNVTAAHYVSTNEEIASISPEGMITANGPGSAFLYATDEADTLLFRTAITVVDNGLSLSLNQEIFALCPEQELTVQPSFNHPVSAVITWESSDSSICSVTQDGTLVGHDFGDAVIRAVLPNGNYTEATVRVMPAITEMDFDKHLYKLKPNTTRQTTLNLLPLDAGEEVIWTSSDPTIATVSQTGELTGLKYGTVTVTATGRYSGRTATCSVKVCNLKQVAITFDDGPSKYTPILLDWLKENEIKATFFVVGSRLSSFEPTLKRIVDEGHELGYHSYSHKYHPGMTSEKITGDFEKTNQMALDVTGQGFTLWRSPGGNYNQRVLDAIPLPHIMWAVDTRDWDTLDKQAVYRAIIRNSDDGEIILLHDLYKTSVDGAIKAMTEMIAGDYEFLTVTELLSRNGTPPQPHTSYKRAE